MRGREWHSPYLCAGMYGGQVGLGWRPVAEARLQTSCWENFKALT